MMTAVAVRGALGVVAALAALGGPPSAPAAAQEPGASPPVARVEVSPGTLEVAVDGSERLTASVFDAAGASLPDAPVVWITTDPDVAAVTGEGLVTGVRPGRARVGVRIGPVVELIDVRVRPLPPATLEAATPVDFLPVGVSVPLRVVARDRNGDPLSDPVVEITVSDPDVARVDVEGRIHGLAPGRVTVEARAGEARASVPLTVQRLESEFTLEPSSSEARTGDVVRLAVRSPGFPVFPAWSVSGAGAQVEPEGREGVFVAERPGTYTITARIGDSHVRTAVVEVEPREHRSRLVELGRGPIAAHHSGDMWVFEGVDGRDYVYVGTFLHDHAKVWDVTDPQNPVLTDSIQLDARRINDVKIHPNGRLGILTREGASSRRNGIVLLDLSTPAHPTILSEYTETVTGGVHNVWIDGENELVYAAHNGTSDVHVLDISDPRNVREVGRWGLERRTKTLHDVIVQDGYAYLSYWDDGVVMLDVGAGTHGGTPTEPAFVSRFAYPVGNTHVAWRSGRYLFIGDEIFPADWDADRPIDARGYIHVVDYQDPENPVEVARYEVPEAGAHNVWVEGDRLYVGYYQAGLRVVDVSGELRGDLYRQGREIARLSTTDEHTTTPNWSMAWGAQVFKGRIYSSDLNSGIWITRLVEDERIVF